jgi:hypothetical protein
VQAGDRNKRRQRTCRALNPPQYSLLPEKASRMPSMPCKSVRHAFE